MLDFGDKRNVNFKLLEDSGQYPIEMIEQLRNGNYNYITQNVDLHLRENKKFMEPLLYAVKNDRGSYVLFKQYGDNLQQGDLDLAIEVTRYEPEIIEDTAISSNKYFMLELVEANPEVIEYMSPELKNDAQFIEQLCELNNSEIITYVAKECNISNVIEKNPELAQNPDFIREVCKADSNAIDYIASNTEKFSAEALIATQEVLRDNFNKKVTHECHEECEKLKQEIKYKKEQGMPVDETVIAKASRMEKRPTVLDERLKGLENGDPKAIRYAHNILRFCKNISEEDKQMLEQSLKIGEAIAVKQKEEQEKSENSSKNIKPEDIEKITNEVRTSKINEATTEIREEYVSQTKEKREVGIENEHATKEARE